MQSRFYLAASGALLLAGLWCLAPERASIVKPARAQLTMTGVGPAGPPSGGGGGSCFSGLSGGVANLDASNSASVVRTGSTITAWNDLSGNGNNFPATNGPQYSATSFPGSLPGVALAAAGSQFFINSSVSFSSTTMWIYAVVTTSNQFQSNGGLVSFVGAGQSNDFGNPASFILAANGSVWRMTSAAYDDSVALTSGAAAAIAWSFDGTNGTGFLNFTPDTPQAKTGTLGNPTAAIVIGARTGGTATYLEAVIAEIGLTSSVPSSGQKSALHTCLAGKWGVP